MADKSLSESIKRKLYTTFYRLGVIAPPNPKDYQNIYIDDAGYVMIIGPDGLIDMMGRLSFSGDFVCKTD